MALNQNEYIKLLSEIRFEKTIEIGHSCFFCKHSDEIDNYFVCKKHNGIKLFTFTAKTHKCKDSDPVILIIKK